MSYSSQFYRRRWVVPAAAAGLAPLVGDRALPSVSLAAYALSGLLVFLLLRLRFDRRVSFGVAALVLVLPAFRYWSAQPLSDSGGVAALTAALIAAVLVLDRGLRWFASAARRGDPRVHPRRLADSRRLDGVGRAAVPDAGGGLARRLGVARRGASVPRLRRAAAGCDGLHAGRVRHPAGHVLGRHRRPLSDHPQEPDPGATWTTSPPTRSRSSSSCSHSRGSRSGQAGETRTSRSPGRRSSARRPTSPLRAELHGDAARARLRAAARGGTRLYPRCGGDSEAPPSGARVCNRQLFVRLAAPGRWCGSRLPADADLGRYRRRRVPRLPSVRGTARPEHRVICVDNLETGSLANIEHLRGDAFVFLPPT